MSDDLTQLSRALAGSYLLERKVGAGGMATVYLAQDLKHQRRVAVKVLRPEIANAVSSERFLREIQIVARLNHPHIIPLHDSGDADGFLYFVMPYVEGESLRQLLRREQQLPYADVLRIATEIADGLAYAHGLGLVHRDIKPENILLSNGHAILADFGIAQVVSTVGRESLTTAGLALGTPAYMSPEQSSGEGYVNARSDIYSLACVVYEMLAGEPPFTGPTAHSVLARKSAGPVPSLRTVRDTVPIALEAALVKALRPIPADRFATVGEFAEALLTGVNGKGTNGRRPSQMGRRLAAGMAITATVLSLFTYLRVRENDRAAKVVVSQSEEPRSATFRLGVLPPEFMDGSQVSRDQWSVIQHLMASELTRHRALAVVDPLSLNSRLEDSATGTTDPVKKLREWDLRYVVRMAITAAGKGHRISYTLTDTREGRVLAGGSFTNSADEELSSQVRIAAGRLLDAVESATGGMTKTLDLDPWLGKPSTSLAAVRAFLQGAEYSYRGMPGGGDHFQRAVDLDPEFVAPRVWLVSGSVARGDTSSALEHVRVLKSLAARGRATPFEQAMVGWADATSRGDRKAKAYHLRVALEYSPRNNVLLYNLGRELITMGQVKEALEPIREAVESRWRFAPLYTLWGVLAIEAGELVGLRETLEGALPITPQSPYLTGVLEALAVSEGDTAAARRLGASFRSQAGAARLPEAYGEMVRVYRSLAQHARESGERRRAVILLQRAVDAAPNDPISRLELARAQAESGDKNAAAESFRTAERRDSAVPELLFLMGEVAALLGHDGDARDYLTKYLTAAPNGVDAVRARERLRLLKVPAGPA